MSRSTVVLSGFVLVAAFVVGGSGEGSALAVPSLSAHARQTAPQATFENTCARSLQLGRGPSLRG